ncbi:MAG TPA: SAM-dependent methyltransferase, partial [Candidatus Solibacter sp.]
MTRTYPLTASFRDPAGSLFRYQGRILRAVNSVGIADLEGFLASPSGQKLMTGGGVVRTRSLDAGECDQLLADSAIRELYTARDARIILEHERIDFPSFPYEWTAE